MRLASRIAVVAFLLTTLALSVPATSRATTTAAASGRSQSLIVGFTVDAVINRSANPFQPTTNLSAGFQQAVYEALFYSNFQTGTLDPWLASGYQFNTSYNKVIITLRKGVTWSDGQPFTSRDVVFTVNMLRAHPDLLNGASLQQQIAAISAPNDLTVVISLKQANPRFVQSSIAANIDGGLIIVPQHIWAGQNPENFTFLDVAKGWPVGTGPYRLSDFAPNQIIFSRNDSWWATKTRLHVLPAPQRVIFTRTAGEDIKAALLSSNQVDTVDQIGFDTIQTVSTHNLKTSTWSAKGWYDPCPRTFIFNTQHKPWNDPQMRQAVSYSIDKAKLASLAFPGVGVPSQWLLPDYPPLRSYLSAVANLFGSFPTLRYDLKRAQAIFESKGYKKGSDGIYVGPDGKQLTLQFGIPSAAAGGNLYSVMAQVLNQDFTDAGILVKEVPLNWGPLGDSQALGSYDASATWSCGGVTDPLATLNNYASDAGQLQPIGTRSTGDDSRFDNAQYNRIVAQMRNLPATDPRFKALFKQALAIFLQQTPAFALAQTPVAIAFSTTYWTDWPTAANGYIQPPSWWMSFHQIIINLKPASS